MTTTNKVTRMVFNNALQASTDYDNVVKRVGSLLERYSNSEYLTTAESHQGYMGSRVTGEIILTFKPDVYVSTKIKVAKQLDEELDRILAEHPDALVDYIVILSKLDEQFFRKYKYLAYRRRAFLLVEMRTESKVTPMDESDALRLLEIEKEKGGVDHGKHS